MRRLFVLLLPLAMPACAFMNKPVPRYEVFFLEGSSQLQDTTYGTISEAASHAVHGPIRPVHVIGYTDRAGSPQADFALSKTRADKVAMALVADGVPPDRIVREAHGPVGGATHVQRRRVEVVVGP